MSFPTMWYFFASRFENSMSVKLQTDHHLEFLSLKGGCTGSSESTLVKVPDCWKSYVTAQFYFSKTRIVYVCLA